MVLNSSEVTLEGEGNVRIASEHVRKGVLVCLRQGQDNVLIQWHSVGRTYEDKRNHKQSNKISMIVDILYSLQVYDRQRKKTKMEVDDGEKKPSSLSHCAVTFVANFLWLPSESVVCHMSRS